MAVTMNNAVFRDVMSCDSYKSHTALTSQKKVFFTDLEVPVSISGATKFSK
jgi:hypothetical protein